MYNVLISSSTSIKRATENMNLFNINLACIAYAEGSGNMWCCGLVDKSLDCRSQGTGFKSRRGTNVLWQDLPHLPLSTQV